MASMIRQRFVRIQSRSIAYPIKSALPVHTLGQTIGVSRVSVSVRKNKRVNRLPIRQIRAPLDLVRLVWHGVPADADLARSDVGDFDRRADLRGEDEAVGDAAVDAGGRFIVEDAGGIGRHGVAGGAVAADVVGDGLIGADGDADVATVG